MTNELKVSGTKAIVKVMPKTIEDRLNNVRIMNNGKGTQNPPHADAKLPPSLLRKVIGGTK